MPLAHVSDINTFILDHIQVPSHGPGTEAAVQLAVCLLNVLMTVVKASPTQPCRRLLTSAYMDTLIHAYFEPSNAPLKAAYLRVLFVLSFQVGTEQMISAFLSMYAGDLLAVAQHAVTSPSQTTDKASTTEAVKLEGIKLIGVLLSLAAQAPHSALTLTELQLVQIESVLQSVSSMDPSIPCRTLAQEFLKSIKST